MRETSIYLIVYTFAWLVSFYFYYKKVNKNGAAGYVIMLNLALSLFSLILFNDKEYISYFNSLAIFPFIYLFVISIIILSPLYSYDLKNANIMLGANKKIILVISIIFIASSIISVPSIISNFSTGISNMLSDNMVGSELYLESLDAVEQTGSGITNLGSILSGAFSGVAYVMLFYYLTEKEKNHVLIYLLIICLFTRAIGSITLGQRGGLVEELNKFIVTYLLFKPFLSKQINKLSRWILIVSVILAIIPISLLTLSRFGQSGAMRSSVIYYAGQSALYFNNYGLDDNGIRYGDRTFPLFKRIVGLNNVPNNFIERRNKYPQLKINDEVFSTYVGDWAIDFGPVAAFIFLLLISFIFTKSTYVQRRKIYFHQILLLHLLIIVCTQGAFKLFPFSDVGGNLRLIVYITAFFLFKYNSKSRQIAIYDHKKLSKIFSYYTSKK